MTGSAKTTRREFLTKACELSAAGFVTAFAWGSLSLRDANARWMPRPPGAVDGKDFLALCSRCGQCVTSCPYETLRLAGPFDPAPGGTPFFVPEEIPCYMCKDIPCVKACPTGALSPALTGISDARMGIAVVDPASCLSHQGLRCEVCYRACPEEEKALTIEMHPRGISRHAMFIPVVHPEHCTGCGLCTKSCPTGTPAIRIADRKAVLGALIVLVLYSLLGSRTFCGWICPMNMVADAAEWLRVRLELKADVVRISNKVRYGLLAAALILSAATGTAAFEAVSPQAWIWRDLVFGTGLAALSAASAVFALDLALMKHGWCGHLCPLGAFWSLVGRLTRSPVVRVSFDDAACNRCGDCLRACPEPHVIRFASLKETGRIPAGDCLNCGRCIEACGENALKFRIGPAPRIRTSSDTHQGENHHD